MTIPYRKYRLSIVTLEPISLPLYKGSTFRGGFGNVFRKILCALKKKECDDCILKTSCVYAYVFETIPRNDTDLMNMGKYQRIPHPFIIEPPGESTRGYGAGTRVDLGLCLVGRAVELLPYFILAFEELGKTGLGKGRGKYALANVVTIVNGNEQTVYSSEKKTIIQTAPEQISLPEHLDDEQLFQVSDEDSRSVTLNFLTPARVMYQRRLADTLDFHVLIRQLLRRLQSLKYFHCGKETAKWDHRQIIAEAENVKTVRSALAWRDWERYSTRQKTRMKMGGLVGEISYEGHIRSFLPFLKAGEVFHVGKGTSFGLGKYVITDHDKKP